MAIVNLAFSNEAMMVSPFVGPPGKNRLAWGINHDLVRSGQLVHSYSSSGLTLLPYRCPSWRQWVSRLIPPFLSGCCQPDTDWAHISVSAMTSHDFSVFQYPAACGRGDCFAISGKKDFMNHIKTVMRKRCELITSKRCVFEAVDPRLVESKRQRQWEAPGHRVYGYFME